MGVVQSTSSVVFFGMNIMGDWCAIVDNGTPEPELGECAAPAVVWQRRRKSTRRRDCARFTNTSIPMSSAPKPASSEDIVGRKVCTLICSCSCLLLTGGSMIAAVGCPTRVELHLTAAIQWLISWSRRTFHHFTHSTQMYLASHSGVGFSVGVVASVVFFRRASSLSSSSRSGVVDCRPLGRTWPIALTTGFGAGTAYADCDRSFNPARVPGTRIISSLDAKTKDA